LQVVDGFALDAQVFVAPASQRVAERKACTAACKRGSAASSIFSPPGINNLARSICATRPVESGAKTTDNAN